MSRGIFGGRRPPDERESLSTVLHLAGQPAQPLEVAAGKGDHGGADPLMLEKIFGPPGNTPDRHRRASDHRAGAWSILTGIAANASAGSGSACDIRSLIETHELRLT